MLQDEKDIYTVGVISAIFIATTLSFNVGMLFVAMIFAYGIALNSGKGNVYQMITGRTDILLAIAAGAVTVGLWFFASQGLFSVLGIDSMNAFSVLASALTVQFTITNPIIQVLTWGIFIPLAETLFFMGVVLKFLMKKTQGREKLTDLSTWIAILMMSAIATMFHVVAKLMNDSALLIVFIFFALSGALVVMQRGQMKGAQATHNILNTYIMAKVVGLFR